VRWTAAHWLTATLLLAMPMARGLSIDEPVPALRAVDLDGNTHSLNDFPGRPVAVLFWQPSNGRSVGALCGTAKLAGSLLTVVSGLHAKSEIEKALGPCPVSFPVLLDPDRSLFAAFQIVALPTLLLMSPDRRLKYKAAGFSSEGLVEIQTEFDRILGRAQAPVQAPTGSPEAIHRHAMALQFLKLGLTAQAEPILRKLTAEHAEYGPGWISLGNLEMAAGRADEAKACFDRALAAGAKPAEVAAGMAWFWTKKGDMAQTSKWAAEVDGKKP
jgi:hypothetical protein